MSDKEQFEFDTLLIVAWRKGYQFKWVLRKCGDININIHEIDRRAFNDCYVGNTPVRAAIAATCESMSNHLWNCKSTEDFVRVRNSLNMGAYKFKGKFAMIPQHVKSTCKNYGDMTKLERQIYFASQENSRKLGGLNTAKRKGGGKI